MSDLAAAPDEAVVSIGFGDEWVDARTHCHFRTIEETQRCLARRGPTWRRLYHHVLTCEVEQHRAALGIGVDPDDMRFRITWQHSKPAGQLKRRWFGISPELVIRHTGTKLDIASIYAAPTRPTEFDLQRLADFGYDGVADVQSRLASR